jgi:peptidoglycan/LPS O-acetylase OafA/YrhL
MTTSEFDAHKNNFNLLRFLAAIQVFISHYVWHFQVNFDGISKILYKYFSSFSGVPIFFFISGFLLYKSFQKLKITNFKKKLKIFFYNRFLRIYPGLIVCFIFSFLILLLSGYLENKNITIKNLVTWIIAQTTVFQFYNPYWLREYGNGVLNGSLWTIPVEIQFYFLIPIIFTLSKKINIFLIIVIFFVILNLIFPVDRSTIINKIYHITFLPHVYIFLLGCLVASKKNIIKYILNLNLFLIIIIHFIFSQFNTFLIIDQMLLFIIVIKIGYMNYKNINKFFNKNDLSYGIYLYHMPIINFILYKNIIYNNFYIILLVLLITSFCSWNFVEKFFLKKKIKF